MNQSILVYAHIDEGAESTDVRHDAREYHAGLQVINRMYGRVERELFRLTARITSRLCQFLHNIRQGRESHFGGDVAVQINLVPQFLVGNQIRHTAALIFSHALDDGITLRVHSAVIERVLTLQS